METTTAPSIPPIRSTNGCWTCRLRKKKCGEERPECVRCTSVNVSCQYGQRPDWISDPALGKAELERIKIRVASSAKRKRAAFRAKSRASPPNLPHDGGDGSSRANLASGSGIFNPGSGAGDLGSCRSLKDITDLSSLFEDNETSLMMHYLDHVFYIQFRFYTPSISAGGRGWLLALLRHTRPLQHAALSLSAFHQQSLLLSAGQSGVGQTQKDYLQELERHHNLTLKELQLFILAQGSRDHPSSSLGDSGSNVQILACMVQLISFELFHGGDSNWQVHLTAASNLILSLQGRSIQSPSSSVPSPQSDASFVCSRNAALHFLTAVIIWFDVLSCVSICSRPHLLSHHSTFFPLSGKESSLGDDAPEKHDLSVIMGCQNWVMVIIGEIAELAHRRDYLDPSSTFDISKNARLATDIQIRLEFRNSQVRGELHEMRRAYSGNPPYYLTDLYHKYTTLVVTYVFGSAALIYLQSATTSNPLINHIQNSLEDVVSAMRMIPDPRMVRGMVWPLCVAGCVASSPDDQAFFGGLAAAAIQDAGTFGNSCKALEVLEMAWTLQREEERLVDCTTSIRRLGTCVLLV